MVKNLDKIGKTFLEQIMFLANAASQVDWKVHRCTLSQTWSELLRSSRDYLSVAINIITIITIIIIILIIIIIIEKARIENMFEKYKYSHFPFKFSPQFVSRVSNL